MDKSIRFTFAGGAGTVTGSKCLLEVASYKLLIDCGLFQGLKALRSLNWENLPFDSLGIDAVLLTHAHLDHVGALPLLYNQGFRKNIYCSAPTYDIAKVILLDSAKIQEEDAERANEMGYSKHHPAKPLYTVEDVYKCLSLFVTCEVNKKYELFDNISFKFKPSAHIFGSCFITVKAFGKKIIFSGDVGRMQPLIQPVPSKVSDADVLVLESTYGNRVHAKENLKTSLASIIKDTLLFKKGTLIIPSFALERAQELMVLINRLKRNKDIPSDIPVYLDSPMASNITEIMLHYPEWHTLSTNDIRDIQKHIIFVKDAKQTEYIAGDKTPKIIIAGSGMLTGGRVLEYLIQGGGDVNNTILISGFQAEGTRGRDLLKSKNTIKIHGQEIEIKAEVKELSGLSGHADQEELMFWLSQFQVLPAKIILNHGEEQASFVLQKMIQEKYPTIKVEIAVMGNVMPI
jgi:metallo-beta-lactamase family protein